MNLELLDPFQQEEVPDIINSNLEDGGSVITCAFNRRGDYVAGGCVDGRCLVWDFETTGIIREFDGHEDKVTSISWSRDSNFILSSSKDKNCIVWNTISEQQVCKLKFDTPIKFACFHPKKKTLILVCPQKHLPILVDISPLDKGEKEIRTLVEIDRVEVAAKTDYLACFSRYGEKIYFGSSKGNIYVYDLNKHKSIDSLKVNAGNSTIKNIHISKKGKDLLVNSSDRQIRVFTIEDNGKIEQQNKFQDPVNQIQWVQCCFSPNADLVIGASDTKPYKIYIWDKEDGNLMRILEGSQNSLVDLAWHPFRREIITVPKNDPIDVWVTTYQENWSAFAPDFQELEENIEYIERENEFDIINESQLNQLKQPKEPEDDDEDEEIDVCNIQRIIYNSDSDSEDEEIFFIPVKPDVMQNNHESYSPQHSTVPMDTLSELNDSS
ncbi:WD40 repeat-like protein [Piromyces finnis]|uniref:WD40 repeat-like protein n=1 Tax=Piromyces finnis TaxID=1754191 RepID=A0A1Y1V599_9FUNG|nr:WD40 repeat-like protein [Piromyces finnis]|eukprot:ORX47093.1 WD40 repeat-like protein [Piromyces finnis]